MDTHIHLHLDNCGDIHLHFGKGDSDEAAVSQIEDVTRRISGIGQQPPPDVHDFPADSPATVQ